MQISVFFYKTQSMEGPLAFYRLNQTEKRQKTNKKLSDLSNFNKAEKL